MVPDLDYQLPFRVDDYREASDSIKDDSDYDDASDVDSEVLDDGDRLVVDGVHVVEKMP